MAPTQTGEIELSKITWDNGVTVPSNLPPDSNIKVPIRFEGNGLLVISEHVGRGMGGSMTGLVTGEISNKNVDEVGAITVSFDINLACAD